MFFLEHFFQFIFMFFVRLHLKGSFLLLESLENYWFSIFNLIGKGEAGDKAN